MKLIYPVIGIGLAYFYFSYKFMFWLCRERVIQVVNEFENQILQ